jgi:hypothetical protein
MAGELAAGSFSPAFNGAVLQMVVAQGGLWVRLLLLLRWAAREVRCCVRSWVQAQQHDVLDWW